MRKHLFATLVVLLLAGSSNLFAQLTASATLQGTVLDKSGAVVPNAEVKITNPATGLTRSATTTDSGTYRFDLLPAGNYDVRISAKGFAIASFPRITLSVSQTTTVDATLEPSQQSEVITVEAAAVLVDVTKTDVSLPISTQMVQDLPLNGRDFVNLAYLAPGARPVSSYDPTKNRVGVFATNGSQGRNVNMTVNGIDNKDNSVGGPVMQLPLEAIQEFNISTQRFSAANGRSEGAAVNVITKSGTNEYHGSLYFFGRNQALNAKNYFEAEKSDFSRQQFGGSIGGPIKKDGTFVFFALERAREQTSINVNPTSYNELLLVQNLGAQPAKTIPTPYYDWRYNGRLDHRFSSKHNFFVSYANQNNRGLNDQSGTNNDLTAGNFTTNQLILASASLNSVLSNSTVNSVTMGYQYWNNLIDSNKYVPNMAFPGLYFGTNGNVPQQTSQAKWQFRDDMAVNKGDHSLKFGVDFVWEPKLKGFFMYNATITLTFLDPPSVILGNSAKYPQGFATPGAITTISDTSGDPYYGEKAKMFGTYFQDDWKVSRRLTLNLGLRYDRDWGLFGSEVQPRARAYLALKSIGSPYAGIPHEDTLDLSPRVGLAYDLTGSGKHILRAGYGIYFGQTFQNIPLFMEQQANPTLFKVVSYNSTGPGDMNADIVPSTGKRLSEFRFGVDPLPAKPAPSTTLGPADQGRLMDPNYRNPYTQQWNGGYSLSLTPNSVIEAEYIHVLGLHESKAIIINPKQLSLGGARFTDALFTAKGMTPLGRIQDNQSINRSRYDGLNIAYRKRMSHRFTVNTSYVLSRAVGYQGYAAGFGNAPTDLNNIFAPHDFGPVGSDERHRGTLSAIVELPGGVRFAPMMQIASARPYNTSQGLDVFGFGGGQGATHAILLKSDPRNYKATVNYSAAQLRACLADGSCFQAPYDSLRGQAFFQTDLRVSKELRFGERARLDLVFQAFDLTNRANFGGNFRGTIRSADFGQPIGFISGSGVIVPRSFSGEFGATFRF
jgi:hypothetical protein